MPLFRRDPRGNESPADSIEGAAAGLTRIVAGTRLEGSLRGSAEVWIDGEVSGSIEISDTLTIGVDGFVHGPIAARIVRVGGRVEGDVQAERIEILAGARVDGDLKAPRMIIAEGAHFEGRANMGTPKVEAPSRPLSPPPSPPLSEQPSQAEAENLPESPSATNQTSKRSASREKRRAKASEGSGKL